jgi:hypothetical protein
MSHHDPMFPNGGDTVGLLDKCSPADRLLVTALRLWVSGPGAQAEVWNMFATRFGPAAGRAALNAFETYLATVARSISRTLWKHGPGCPCIGRDEADLAAIVALAARGETGLATARAARFVRADRLGEVIAAAGPLGRALASPRSRDMEGSARRSVGFPTLH